MASLNINGFCRKVYLLLPINCLANADLLTSILGGSTVVQRNRPQSSLSVISSPYCCQLGTDPWALCEHFFSGNFTTALGPLKYKKVSSKVLMLSPYLYLNPRAIYLVNCLFVLLDSHQTGTPYISALLSVNIVLDSEWNQSRPLLHRQTLRLTSFI